MGRRSEHSRTELQELIIQATGELIDTHGVGHVTARMIAEAVDYTPGMLYSVFKNLDDIFLHVNTGSLEELRTRCQSASQDKDSPRDAILAIGNAYMGFAISRENRFKLMFKWVKRGDMKSTPVYLEKSESLFELITEQLKLLSPNATEKDLNVGSRSLWCGLHGATTSAISGHLMSQVWRADEPVVRSLVQHYLVGWEQQFSR